MKKFALACAVLLLCISTAQAGSATPADPNQPAVLTPAPAKAPPKERKQKKPSPDDDVLAAIGEIREDVRNATTRLADVEGVTVDLHKRVVVLEQRQETTLVALSDLEDRYSKRVLQVGEIVAIQQQQEECQDRQDAALVAQGAQIQGLKQEVGRAWAAYHAADAAAAPKGFGKILAFIAPRLLGHH